MLINFCQKCVQTTATCNTVSNDGYEVTNLISDSDRGFLAYSCIKPPIHVDLTFICDIRVNHILIWPSVGAQKSSGFELSVKFENEYKRAATGFLSPSHSGLLFYRRDVDSKSYEAPTNFLSRYIQLSNVQSMNRVRNLRLTILKTENSVPAIGRIEVWGAASLSNDRETVSRILTLCTNNKVESVAIEAVNNLVNSENVAKTLSESVDETTSVPDCFLDPITCNIMIQPIVLPSGVIIDQSTLEKHGASEATWGRSLSDPFTGISFNDSRKPIIASALKARIDKYLLENKNLPEVKRMPRLSGHKQVPSSLRNRTLELSEIIPHFERGKILPNSSSLKIDKVSTKVSSMKLPIASAKIQREIRAHKLPIIPMSSKRGISKLGAKMSRIKTKSFSVIKEELKTIEQDTIKDGNLEKNVDTVLSKLRRFGEKNIREKKVKCLKNCLCSSNIFYKFPCNHILCRDVLMSVRNSQCPNCKAHFHSRDLERIHLELG